MALVKYNGVQLDTKPSWWDNTIHGEFEPGVFTKFPDSENLYNSYTGAVFNYNTGRVIEPPRGDFRIPQKPVDLTSLRGVYNDESLWNGTIPRRQPTSLEEILRGGTNRQVGFVPIKSPPLPGDNSTADVIRWLNRGNQPITNETEDQRLRRTFGSDYDKLSKKWLALDPLDRQAYNPLTGELNRLDEPIYRTPDARYRQENPIIISGDRGANTGIPMQRGTPEYTGRSPKLSGGDIGFINNALSNTIPTKSTAKVLSGESAYIPKQYMSGTENLIQDETTGEWLDEDGNVVDPNKNNNTTTTTVTPENNTGNDSGLPDWWDTSNRGDFNKSDWAKYDDNNVINLKTGEVMNPKTGANVAYDYDLVPSAKAPTGGNSSTQPIIPGSNMPPIVPTPVGGTNGTVPGSGITPITGGTPIATSVSGGKINAMPDGSLVDTSTGTTVAPAGTYSSTDTGWFSKITGALGDTLSKLITPESLKLITTAVGAGASTAIQTQGAEQMIAFIKDRLKLSDAQLAPYIKAGEGALANLVKMGETQGARTPFQGTMAPEAYKYTAAPTAFIGSTDTPTPFKYDPSKYYESPVYQALNKEGMNAVNASMGARGLRGSGSQGNALMERAQQIGAQYMTTDANIGQQGYTNAVNDFTLKNTVGQQNYNNQSDAWRNTNMGGQQGFNNALNVVNANNIVGQQGWQNQTNADIAAWNRQQQLANMGTSAITGQTAAGQNATSGLGLQLDNLYTLLGKTAAGGANSIYDLYNLYKK